MRKLGLGEDNYESLKLRSAGDGSTSALNVQEVDGTPTVSGVNTIIVTNGTLTDNGGGAVTLDLSGGGPLTLGIINVKDYGAVGDGVADDTAAINNAWGDVVEGSLLYFPPGEYAITDTIAFKNKNYVTVQGETSSIITKSGSNFASKALVDIAGSDYLRMRGLRIYSTLSSNKPAAGLVLGRIDAGDGAGQYLDSVWVSGTFTYAAVYDVGAELTTYLHCRFHTTDAVPSYYTSSTDDGNLVAQDSVSNVCKRFYSCSFLNYGSSPANVIEAHGNTSELSLRDCFIGMDPAGSHGIHLSGTSASCNYLTIENVRFEGKNHANSRLLYDAQDNALDGAQIGPLIYSIESDYAIDMASSPIIYSTVDFKSGLAGSTKMFRLNTFGNSYNVIYGRGAGMIEVTANSGFFANFVAWFSSGNPITGSGYSDYYTRQDNVIMRLTDYNTSVGISSRRVEGSALDTGTTPSVAGMDWYLLNYSTPTTITDFADPVNGQVVHFVAATGNSTIEHNTNIKLRGNAKWTLPAGATLTLMYDNQNGVWYEVARMNPNESSTPAFLFGDGSDGDETIIANTTLSVLAHYDNLTIDAGKVLTVDSMLPVYVRNTLTINGTIRSPYSDADPGNNNSGSTMGGGGAGEIYGANGGNASANGTSGSSPTTYFDQVFPSSAPQTGGSGGNGAVGTGGAGGVGADSDAYYPRNYTAAANGQYHLNNITASSVRTVSNALPGGAGGGGGGNTKGGGGGGGSGYSLQGYLSIISRNIVWGASGVIESKGGNGGDGGASDGDGGGGGGGAGGNGGIVILCYDTEAGTRNVDVSGGTGGTGGTSASANAGGNGPPGHDGVVIELKA